MVKKGGERDRGSERGMGAEGGRVGGTERGSVVCDPNTTTQTVSLIISETNRTVKRHIMI